MAPSIKDMVAVRPMDKSSAHANASTDKQEFIGLRKFDSMGNRLPIAFGGCVISQCISAGFGSLGQPSKRPPYELYSALGCFLGPGATEIFTTYEVEDIRTTRAFATRVVTAWQDWSQLPADSKLRKQGSAGLGRRRIMVVTLDFQVREKYSIMEYSPVPIYAQDKQSAKPFVDKVKNFYSHPSELLPGKEMLRQNHSKDIVDRFESIFTLFDRFYEHRPVQKSMGMQKALGIDKTRKTTQDNAPFQERNNSAWYALKDHIELDESDGGPEAAMGFIMDGALAFLPLTFSHRFLWDADACSTLEFSLRFMTPVSWTSGNDRNWFLQEQTTEAGRNGRTFSTGRMWDVDGNLVAVMTQFSIMRGNADTAIGASKPKL